MNQLPPAFWSVSVTDMLQKLETTKNGLTDDQYIRLKAQWQENRMVLSHAEFRDFRQVK